ncbi:hypothetical protein [Streptomyces sp. NPDC018972]|uniref:hypothetical protein n=1 Tax=Streptomyces sp. NPDC018972 TaxID=3365060 RepID=UPI00378EEFAC
MGMCPMRTPDHCPRRGRRLVDPPAERVAVDGFPAEVTYACRRGLQRARRAPAALQDL